MKFWSANYSACVVYTKTIIHLSVGESDGYLPPLQRIIVNCYPTAANTVQIKVQIYSDIAQLFVQ